MEYFLKFGEQTQMTLSRLAKNRDKQSNFQSIHVPLSYLSLSYSYSNSDMLSVSLHYIPYPSLSVSTSTFICSLCPIWGNPGAQIGAETGVETGETAGTLIGNGQVRAFKKLSENPSK